MSSLPMGFSCAVACVTALLGQDAARIGKHRIGETLQEWQSIEPKRANDISPHRLGESFDEWANIEGIEFKETCPKQMIRKVPMCHELWTIRDLGMRVTYHNDRGDWEFDERRLIDFTAKGLSPLHSLATEESDTPDRKIRTIGGRRYEWNFLNGRLSDVTVTPNWGDDNTEALDRASSFESEVDMLTGTASRRSTRRNSTRTPSERIGSARMSFGISRTVPSLLRPRPRSSRDKA